MESWCVDSKPESTHDKSTLKRLESTPIDFRVEFLVKYSKLELMLANFKLEFIVKLEFPTTLIKKVSFSGNLIFSVCHYQNSLNQNSFVVW